MGEQAAGLDNRKVERKTDFVRNTTQERREKRREVIKSALIIKKKELSTFIMEVRRDKVQSQIRRFARIFDIFQAVVPRLHLTDPIKNFYFLNSV
jgi:hypothetical protein